MGNDRTDHREPSAPPTTRRRQAMFASFAVRNYRYFFAGALVSNLGTWIQRIGQDWLVLTELTANSSTALGIVTALQFLALPLLAPYGGAIADRFPKRKVLLVTQVLLGVTSLALWLLVATGTVQLWHVFVLAFAQGAVAAFDNPARQSFVSEMVEPGLLPNAVGLNATSFNGARLFGPGLAGLLIGAFGVAPALLINAISFIALIIALAVMHREELHPAPQVRARRATRDGLAYIRRRPDIVILLVIVFVLGTFGLNFQIYNATMATQVFEVGAEEFGLLGTIMAIGTLAGALTATRRVRPRFRTVLLSLSAFAVSTVLLAFAPGYWFYAALLVPAGFTSLTVMTTANASVQLATVPEFRGRVMAIYMAIFMGGTPLGAPIVGWLGDTFRPRASVLIGAVTTGLCAVGVLVYLMVHDRLRLRIERRRPWRVTVWTAPEARSREVSAGEGIT